MNRISRGALGAAALCLLASPGSAHVTLAVAEASAGGAYRAVLRVGHGCDGAATTRLSVRVPEGVLDAKPMPKPGWTLEVRRAPYAKSYTLWGKPLSEGVVEITWRGALADAHYDEFTFVARLAGTLAPGTTLPFPVVQTCERGAHEWTGVAAAGQDPHALENPAPVLRVVAGADAAPRAGGLVVEGPWARATPGGARVAAGYLRVRNEGPLPDRLVGASIPLAGRAEVHTMSTEGGIMRMRPVEGGIVIPPGGAIELKPGADHLMFMDLSGGLKEGETVRGTLVFERAGTVPVTFQVGGIGAAGPAGAHQHH